MQYPVYYLLEKGMIYLIENEREFSKMCIKHGFLCRAPRFYVRCIGDGIYQTIYTGFKKYIPPDSPSYSPEKRKSYYISIGIRSLYSQYDERVFSSDKDSGGYSPADLNKKCKHSGLFHGIESDYRYMDCGGFNVLDTITTQEKLLEWWDAIQVIDTGSRIHDLHLVEPLLLCGNINCAEVEISISYIQCMDAYISYLDHVRCGRFIKDNSYEQRIRNSLSEQLQLWRWCAGRNKEELNEYLQANYARNMAWVQKYGIPAVQISQPRFLESV